MTSAMIAFTFPGQGSQAPQMGETWVKHPSWELVEEASDAAERDVAKLLLEADADELKRTDNSQLATYVTSMIILDAVERVGIDAAFYAGHSLGEYSALTAAGALSFSAGVKLVTERGNAMAAAAEAQPGTMAAVLGLEDDQVDMVCRRVDGDVWVANYNAPGQVVIAGDSESIEKASVAAKELGAKRVIAIKVGGAFHTPFMSPARDRLRKALSEIDLRSPSRPVYANIDALPHVDATEWVSLLGAQLTSPVRWHHTLTALQQAGATLFLELGPGSVLTGMAKRTVKDARNISVNSPEGIDTLIGSLAQLTENESDDDHEGEVLYAKERLVISPCSGVFQPTDDVDNGTKFAVGQLLGTVGDSEVRSPFAGHLQGLLALAGEKVNTSQPLAWLRTADLGIA